MRSLGETRPGAGGVRGDAMRAQSPPEMAGVRARAAASLGIYIKCGRWYFVSLFLFVLRVSVNKSFFNIKKLNSVYIKFSRLWYTPPVKYCVWLYTLYHTRGGIHDWPRAGHAWGGSC